MGRLARRLGLTVRTLHHYDEIGLLVPSRRSGAGYRLYTEDDLTRLQHVVVYRRLGFALEEIALLLDDPAADVERAPAPSTRGGHVPAGGDARSRHGHRPSTGAADEWSTADEAGAARAVRRGFLRRLRAEAERRWGDSEVWAPVAGPDRAVHQGGLAAGQGRGGGDQRGVRGRPARRRAARQRGRDGRRGGGPGPDRALVLRLLPRDPPRARRSCTSTTRGSVAATRTGRRGWRATSTTRSWPTAPGTGSARRTDPAAAREDPDGWSPAEAAALPCV